MNTSQIIVLVLTSSLLAAILTSVANWLIQRNNYRDEYFKKLLDKRLQAYEEVQGIVERLTKIVQLEDGRFCHLVCHLGRESYDFFFILVGEAMKKSFWLSEDVSETLTRLNILLLEEINNKINDSEVDNDSQTIELGAQNIEKIRSIKQQLEGQLYKDFAKLHKLGKFVNETREHKTYPLKIK